MSKISDLASKGIFFTPMEDDKPKQEDGDFVRGLKKAAYQIPQTLGGTAALVGDVAGIDGLRDYGMEIYQNNEEKIQGISKPTDSLTSVLNGEEDTSAIDWAQNAAGYTVGQAATALATGGVGGFIGSQLAKRGIREVVARGAQSAIAKQVAGKVASKGAQIGAGVALGASNLSQEAGSIYPEAVRTAEEEGRTLTGADKARVIGSALGAAAVETGMDALMVGRVLKGARAPGESIAKAAVREIPGAMGREAITEGIQTGIERYGAGQQLSTADAIRDYVDSMGVGAIGGGLGGAAGVLHARKVPESGMLTKAANAGIDEQILQLAHDPQPLIAFPDGSVGHKQDLEAYLSQFEDPDERLAKHRELLGRDPATGKRPEPEPAPEPIYANTPEAEALHLKAWTDKHDPVPLDYAQALLNAPGAKGQDLMIVPHPKGKGYTLVPSKWLTLDTQARAAALQKGEEAMLPSPDMTTPDNVIRVDSEGGAAPQTYGEQARTNATKRAMDAKAAEEARRRQELGTPVPYGAKAEPKPAKPIMNKVGKPFATEFAAKSALRQSYADTHEVTPAEGGNGFVLMPKKAAPDADAIEAAAHEAATSPENDLPEPTQAQKEAGNYKKGHVTLHGLDISIENPRGSVRRGVDKSGKPWENELAHHYGYIKRTEGADGDHVDSFIGNNLESQRVYIVDQIDPDTGAFDEHKVVFGANSLDEAREIYQANYAKGWKGGKNVSETSVEGFKAWLKDGDTKKPFAPQAEKPKAKRKTRKDEELKAAREESSPKIDFEAMDKAAMTPPPESETEPAKTATEDDDSAPELAPEHTGFDGTGPKTKQFTSDEFKAAAAQVKAVDDRWKDLIAKHGQHFEDGGKKKKSKPLPTAPAEVVAEYKAIQKDRKAASDAYNGALKSPKYGTAAGNPIEDTAPVDESIIPITMDKDSFATVLDEWAAIVADPQEGEAVRMADKTKGELLTPEQAKARIAEWKAHVKKQGKEHRSENFGKTVLSLFDLTGEWSKPWEEAGYNVIRFDIQNGQDVNDFSVEYFTENYDLTDVYAILAATPCTDFASSGSKHFLKKDEAGLTEMSVGLVNQTMRTIEYFRPQVWALENPVGRIQNLTGLPDPRLTFDPNHFGDPYTKKTMIWGRFNADLPGAPVEPTEGSKMWSQYGGKSVETKNARSETPEGFSYAFFMANNYIDMPAERKLVAEYPEAAGAVREALKAGISEQEIHDLMEDTYGNYEYEEARNALIQAVADRTKKDAPRDEMQENQRRNAAAWGFDPDNIPEQFDGLEVFNGAKVGVRMGPQIVVAQAPNGKWTAAHSYTAADGSSGKLSGIGPTSPTPAYDSREDAIRAQLDALKDKIPAKNYAEMEALTGMKPAKSKALQERDAKIKARKGETQQETATAEPKPAPAEKAPAPLHNRAAGLPDDLKTYTPKEAGERWDGLNDYRRGSMLSRVDLRDTPLQAKSWADMTADERRAVKMALDEDFYSPVWYINKAGQQIPRAGTPAVPKAPEKTAAELADEAAGKKWAGMAPGERRNALLQNGISGPDGRDADQGQYTAWDKFAPDLRVKLAAYFDENKPRLSMAEIEQQGREAFAAGKPREDGKDLKLVPDVLAWMRGWDAAKADADAEAAGMIAKPSEFPTKDVAASYSGISHQGDSRARSDRDAFMQTVQDLYDEAKKQAETPAQLDALNAAIAEFKADYLKQTKSLANVRSGTYSGHIAGRSGLNAKQANSRNSALDKALDRFADWKKGAAPKVLQAVLDARSPEQLNAIQAEKDAKAAAKQAKNDKFLSDLLNFKKGDSIKIGGAEVARVSYGADGLPSSLTLSGPDLIKGVTDKFKLVPDLYKTKADLQAAVDRVRAAPVEKAPALQARDEKIAATAQHVENGKTEPATAEVIADSIQKSADRTPMNYKEAKAALLADIDAAITKRKASKAKAGSPAKLTFDVEGDGKFTVLNEVENLQEFRKKVAANKGFDANYGKKGFTGIPFNVSTSPAGTINQMLEEGEKVAAYELAKVIGKPFRFTPKVDGGANAFLDARDVEGMPHGVKGFVGNLRGEKENNWMFIEATTGQSVGGAFTSADAAERGAREKLGKITKAQLDELLAKHQPIDPDALEAEWVNAADAADQEYAERQDAESRRRAEEARKDAADLALWNEVMDADAAGLPFNPAPTFGMVSNALKKARLAGKLEEMIDLIERKATPSYNQGIYQKAFDEARAVGGTAPTPEDTIEAAGFKIRNGDLTKLNSVQLDYPGSAKIGQISVHNRQGKLYQAYVGTAQSRPGIELGQAIEWLKNWYADEAKAAETEKAAKAKALQEREAKIAARKAEEAAKGQADTRQPWEMTLAEYTKQRLDGHEYADALAEDSDAMKMFTDNVERDWTASINSRAKAGRIPDTVLDDMVNRKGIAFVQSMFRGVNEPGMAGYLTPDLRVHGPMNMAEFDRTMEAVTSGEISALAFKAAYRRLVESEAQIKTELNGKNKDALLQLGGAGFAYRYKNDKKAEVIEHLYDLLLREFAVDGVPTISYGMSSGFSGYRAALQAALNKAVEDTTDAQLKAYSQRILKQRAEHQAEMAERAKGMEDPKTLEDFKNLLRNKINGGMSFKDARLSLTLEQRATFDELTATATRSERASRKVEKQEQAMRAPGQPLTATETIKTQHTKHGHDLWQFNLEQRVSSEEFKDLAEKARRLGGNYSSYRGNGAIPGWQFRTPEAAQAFKDLIAGDATAAKEVMAARRDAFADDKSQSAAERLEEMAARLEEQADESDSADRKTNTARRARFAAAAEAAAARQRAMAETMRKVAAGIKDGSAKFLDRVRQKVQVELLDRLISHAVYVAERENKDGRGMLEDRMKRAPTMADVDHAEWPQFTAFRSDLAMLGRQLLEIDGTKKMGQQILKVADDVSDAYMQFAKDNLIQVGTFRDQHGNRAAFPSKQTAELSIERSGYRGKAIVLPVKRGENVIVLSPSEAMKRGIWQGDDDKKITLDAEFGAELVEKLGRINRRTNRVDLPWQFETAAYRRAVLARMGIETPAEMRAALREYVALKVAPKEADRIKELERAMIWRRNDGMDFFPTPADQADEMIAVADIGPDMSILEPSAGMGHIADRIRDAGYEPDVIELSGDRRELLEAKGYNIVASDFMDMTPRGFTYGDVFKHKDGRLGILGSNGGLGSSRYKFIPLDGDKRSFEYVDRDDLEGFEKRGTDSGYDRIIMNPPFSDRRDAQHVMHAYDLLKPGGRLVAIVGEGVFFGQDKKAQEFRDWLEQHGGTSEKLAEGTFLDPSLPVNTGVNARMIVVDKPASDVAPVPETDDALRASVGDAVLRLDLPLSAQPYGVRRALSGEIKRLRAEAWNAAASMGDPDRAEDRMTGQQLLDRIAERLSSQADAADYLQSLGIRDMRNSADMTQAAVQLGEAGPLDAKIAGMVKEGVTVDQLLETIEQQSSAPELRTLAKSLRAIGLKTGILFGDPKGATFTTAAANEGTAGGAYSHAKDMAYLYRAENAERTMLHELVHAATLNALQKGGLAATQLKALWNSLKGNPALIGEYGMSNEEEFIAEAYTNPRFRQILADTPIPGTKLTFWQKLMGIVRIILGKPAIADNVLERVMAVGADLMAENQGDAMPSGDLRAASGERASLQEQAKKLGLPANKPSEELYSLIRILKTDPKAWTRADLDAVGPYLTLHQDVREGSADRVQSIMRDGLNSGMGDSVGDLLAGRFTWTRGKLKGGDAYLFVRDAVKYQGRGSAYFAPGNVPLIHFRAEKGQDLLQALNQTGERNDQGSADLRASIAGYADKLGVRKDVSERISDLFASEKTFNSWWHKTIGTQYHKAQIDSDFKRVYDATQRFLSSVSLLANEAADAAPSLLPKLEGFRDLAKKPPKKADLEAVATAVFKGTLTDGRVYSDAELKNEFKLTDAQIGMYREFRAAVDRSLDDMGKTDLIRYVGKDYAYMRSAVMGARDVNEAAELLVEELEQTMGGDDVINTVRVKANNYAQLKIEGYAPLMRFGEHTVYVTGKNGEQLFFGMAESGAEAAKLARDMQEIYPDATVTKGILSTEGAKLFSGISPDTIEIFANVTGLSDDPLFQDYLKLVVNNRSALKRLIHRKGVPGYSEDVTRVLASFLTSNARASAKNLHSGEMLAAAEAIPKTKGDVRDEAIRLVDYIQNPVEEAAKVRGLLFANFIGGSIASAAVNMTQPVMMTLPYLSQWGGAAKAAKTLFAAMKTATMGDKAIQDEELRTALQVAENQGVVSPQEIHNLQAEAMRKSNGLTIGGKEIIPAFAARKIAVLWGGLFGLAEQFNRKATFIAAYQTARDMTAQQLREAGVRSPYDFAVKAIAETQGVYNRGNRPNWARGAVGATLMTFKQYSIAYMEFLQRLPTKERALALAILVVAAGINGLPFADDLDDVIDTIAQALGYNWQTKKARDRFLTAALGQGAADFVLHGVSGVAGMPLDVSMRMGMQNLLPATGIFLKSNEDKSYQYSEILGAAGGLAQRAIKAGDNILAGDVGGAAVAIAPTAFANVIKGMDMLETGAYRDSRGRKVIDTDTTDAIVKMIGFQPAEVAREQDKLGMARDTIAVAKAVEKRIADEWARGVYEGDREAAASARREIDEWNRKNPDSRINITMAQISKRLREMHKEKADRLVSTAPKAMRSALREELGS